MRKFLSAALLVILFSSVSYGAVSGDMSVYVRQDVFEARMDRLEAMINEKLTKFASEIQSSIQDIRGDIKVLNARVDGLEKRMSGLETTVYWILGLLSFVVGALALTPLLKEVRKPSITLEDVERLIDAKLAVRPQV